MSDSAARSQTAALFLFAHQDDEFGAFQKILDEIDAGRQVYCAYFTSGVTGDASPAARDKEAVAVLGKLGVPATHVLFVGAQLGIDDGGLLHRMEDAMQWLQNWMAARPGLGAMYMPAWEGGHPDHDALHALAVIAASDAGLADSGRQFSLYNAYRMPKPFFNVQRPLPMNGPVENVPVKWRQRALFLRHCLSYPTQRKTWLGLFPFVLVHYVTVGSDALQRISRDRLTCRPHEGALYYERRKFCTWQELSAQVARLNR